MQERTAFGVAGVTEASSQWNHDACLEQKGAAAESSRAGIWGETGRDGERRGRDGEIWGDAGAAESTRADGGGARGARAWSAAARAPSDVGGVVAVLHRAVVDGDAKQVVQVLGGGGPTPARGRSL